MKKNKLFSGKRRKEPEIDLWERLRLERIEQIKKQQQKLQTQGVYGKSNLKGLNESDLNKMTLQELNALTRSRKYTASRIKAFERSAVGQRLSDIKNQVGDAHERFKRIMDNIRSEDRDEVREMDSDDVFEAADSFVDSTEGLWTEEQFNEWLLKKKPKNLIVFEDILG